MGLRRALDFRLIFSYYSDMSPTPSSRKTFVVTCKQCRRDVPSGVKEFPFSRSPSSAPCAASCAGTCHLRSSSGDLTNSWFGSSGAEAGDVRAGRSHAPNQSGDALRKIPTGSFAANALYLELD
jgi:hypothetical protein